MPPRLVPHRKVILDAYMAEGEGLQQIHVHVAKELKRLQLEENMLMHLLEQTKKHLPPDSEVLKDEDLNPPESQHQEPERGQEQSQKDADS